MSKDKSITLAVFDLQTWFVIIMVLCFGLVALVGMMHHEMGARQRQYQQDQRKAVQADQKKLDDFRY